MNSDQLIALLATAAQFAEAMPFHWVAIAGVALAGVVAVLRKVYNKPAPPEAEIAQAPMKQFSDLSASAPAKSVATVTDIADKTLNQK